MVKAEIKATAEKPLNEQTAEGCNTKMDDEKKAEMEEMVVYFEEQQRRRSPRACVFICLLVLVLLVGFLVVYAIEKSKSEKKGRKGWEYGDDYIEITPTPELSNDTYNTWCTAVSLETKHEYLTLSDAISSEDIMGLRPVFRKDLPHDYVAYWEAKLNGKTGEKYVILSAAKETGDHRLVEKGRLPSPSDLLTDQARLNGHGCHRVYRLSPDGLMACEDSTKKKIVAANRNIDSDSWNVDWRKLDKQISDALPRLSKEWGLLAKRVKKTPQWNNYKWLSMPSGETPQITTTVESKKKWPTRRPSTSDTEFNFQVEETDDGLKAELGLFPGDTVRIPLGRGFREVRIKFVGLQHGGRQETKGWQKRWQKRLCKVLCDLCSGEEYFDMTKINQRFFKVTRMGDQYIKVKVDADEKFVRRHLKGREIHFRVELQTHGSRVMVINYGIVLKSRRYRRFPQEKYFSIPHEELLPSYHQHQRGQCMTGSGPVAWVRILGYFQNVISRKLNSNFSIKNPVMHFTKPLPLTMNPAVGNFTNIIFNKLDSHCSPLGRGVTSPARMVQIHQALNEILGPELTVIHREEPGKEDLSQVKLLMINLLRRGYPVIVSKESGSGDEHHYMVVTRIKERVNSYRWCDQRTGHCSHWSLESEPLMYVAEESGKRRWESADSRFVAAIIRENSMDVSKRSA